MNVFHEPSNGPCTYPCGICNKTIGKNQKYIICELCNHKVHIKCNEIDDKTYLKIKNDEITMFCIKF